MLIKVELGGPKRETSSVAFSSGRHQTRKCECVHNEIRLRISGDSYSRQLGSGKSNTLGNEKVIFESF